MNPFPYVESRLTFLRSYGSSGFISATEGGMPHPAGGPAAAAANNTIHGTVPQSSRPKSAGEALLDAHQQKVVARMRSLQGRSQEWQEKHDRLAEVNAKLVKEVEALRVLYELEVSRRKSVEAELRVLTIKPQAGDGAPLHPEIGSHSSSSNRSQMRWATNRPAQTSCSPSTSTSVAVSHSGEGGTEGRHTEVVEVEGEEAEELLPLRRVASVDERTTVETKDDHASQALTALPAACNAEGGGRGAGKDEEALAEALVVVGVSDDKLLQVLNHRRAKEKERERARAAAAWREAAERDRKAAASASANSRRRSRKWSSGSRGSKDKAPTPQPDPPGTEYTLTDLMADEHDEDPEEELLHPEVLASFAAGPRGAEASVQLPHGLADFALPAGAQVKEVSMGSSMSQVWETLFGSSNAIGLRHRGCFVFALLRDEREGVNTDMSPLWGVCIIHPGVRRFYVQADGSLSSFQDLSLSGTVEGGAAFVDVVVPRSYCLLTRCPFFSVHLKILAGLLEADRLIRVYEMASMAPREDGSLCKGLNLLLLQKVAKACGKLSWPVVGQVVLLDLLEEGGGDEEEEDGLLLLDPIDLSLPPDSTATLLTEPDLCPALLGREGRCLRALTEWNLPLVLHRLPLKTLTQTMGLLLCEMQVAVVCDDLALLSACTMGLSLLLRPLRWVGMLVPVLPSRLSPLLDAPIPFLVGISGSAATETLQSRRGLAILDLNGGALRVHAGDAVEGQLDPSLTLPNLHALNDALRAHKTRLTSSCNSSAQGEAQRSISYTTPSVLASARTCQAIIYSHIQSIIQAAHACPSHRQTPELGPAAAFYERLRRTQMWSVHSEGLAAL